MLLTNVDSADEYAQHVPDASWVVSSGDRITARCSCWWRSVPHLRGERLGLVGHYAAEDDASAQQILRRACERLRAEGCTLAVGPIDGSTWRRYRFITDRAASAFSRTFFLEPDNEDSWPLQFAAEGFKPLAAYRSALSTDLERAVAEAAEAEKRLRNLGVAIRSIDLEDSVNELRRIYKVSIESFADNFLYTPIDESEFTHLYRSVLPLVRPDLVSVAEVEGEPVGFLFAVPDVLEARRTPEGSTRTIVVKTLAVTPRWQGIGLGTALVTRTHAIAWQQGFVRAIHALMHDSNPSQRISGKDTQTIRRYTLFARPL